MLNPVYAIGFLVTLRQGFGLYNEDQKANKKRLDGSDQTKNESGGMKSLQ